MLSPGHNGASGSEGAHAGLCAGVCHTDLPFPAFGVISNRRSVCRTWAQGTRQKSPGNRFEWKSWAKKLSVLVSLGLSEKGDSVKGFPRSDWACL